MNALYNNLSSTTYALLCQIERFEQLESSSEQTKLAKETGVTCVNCDGILEGRSVLGSCLYVISYMRVCLSVCLYDGK